MSTPSKGITPAYCPWCEAPTSYNPNGWIECTVPHCCWTNDEEITNRWLREKQSEVEKDETLWAEYYPVRDTS